MAVVAVDRRRDGASSARRWRVTQFNLKKVLAYSTISQIGFMVMACGVGAFSVGALPPHDARVLQGLPVPRRRRRAARAAGRGGHAQHGRARAQAALHLRHVPGGHAGALRNSAVRRLLLEGRDPLAGLVGGRAARPGCGSSVSRPPGSPRSTCSARSTSRSSARVASRNGFGPACTSRRLRCRSCSPCSPSARSSPGSSECPAVLRELLGVSAPFYELSRAAVPRGGCRASRCEHRDRADGDRAARGGRGHLPGVALLRSRRPRARGVRKRRGRSSRS